MIISAKTKLLCVIGDPIEHSMSPKMHNAAINALGLDYVYVAFNVKKDNLERAVEGFRGLNITGVNVTIPLKIDIMKYLDGIKENARAIGAVNTIKNENGRLIGTNTDGDGALAALESAGVNVSEHDTIILGAGGAARAVSHALSKKARTFTIAARRVEQAIKLAKDISNPSSTNKIQTISMNDKKKLEEQVKNSTLIINATPVGMFPKIDNCIIEKDWLPEKSVVFDLVYNPIETKLVKIAKQKNCTIVHGLDMLVHQGAKAFEWWTNKTPPIKIMKKEIIDFLSHSRKGS
ncbi:MAG: shikimate dehydrogenase [Promethearchaeota archaeon]